MECCEQFQDELFYLDNRNCKHNQFECPDTIILRVESGFAISVKDGGDSYLEIKYCPWCGKDLSCITN